MDVSVEAAVGTPVGAEEELAVAEADATAELVGAEDWLCEDVAVDVPVEAAVGTPVGAEEELAVAEADAVPDQLEVAVKVPMAEADPVAVARADADAVADDEQEGTAAVPLAVQPP